MNRRPRPISSSILQLADHWKDILGGRSLDVDAGPPPPWECRSEEEARRFEEWTNSKLNELLLFRLRDDQLGGEVTRLLARAASLSLAIEGIETGNGSLIDAVDDVEVLRHVLKGQMPRQGAGRPRGQQQPWGHRKFSLDNAAGDVADIRAIWQHYYNRKNRSLTPTAHEIAARRWCVTVGDIIDYNKNKPQSGGRNDE